MSDVYSYINQPPTPDDDYIKRLVEATAEARGVKPETLYYRKAFYDKNNHFHPEIIASRENYKGRPAETRRKQQRKTLPPGIKPLPPEESRPRRTGQLHATHVWEQLGIPLAYFTGRGRRENESIIRECVKAIENARNFINQFTGG